MSDRVYASVFYIVLIVGSSWAAVTVGEALAREALTRLALVPSLDQRPSRVIVGLAAQEAAQLHAAAPQNAKEALVPAAPSMPVGALAKALDDAEQNGDREKATTIVPRPRVADWAKRLAKPAAPAPPDESSGHIIMRTLRAEM
jgi:hypothetical protein